MSLKVSIQVKIRSLGPRLSKTFITYDNMPILCVCEGNEYMFIAIESFSKIIDR